MATETSARSELTRFNERLLEYYTLNEALLWVRTAHPQLNGEIPSVLIDQGRFAELHAILDRLDSGGYL